MAVSGTILALVSSLQDNFNSHPGAQTLVSIVLQDPTGPPIVSSQHGLVLFTGRLFIPDHDNLRSMGIGEFKSELPNFNLRDKVGLDGPGNDISWAYDDLAQDLAEPISELGDTIGPEMSESGLGPLAKPAEPSCNLVPRRSRRHIRKLAKFRD
ncbi:hypothetical protein Salat_2144400 [Sesamum alatum]|uniref:Uncharacterized protein n=1 Tax=Sesamum alatum TaxID=300844 RepID=A0AAE2CH54_9LAMI|nr:hypothetical protein Salat_2144400 [Sesamum alatum]